MPETRERSALAVIRTVAEDVATEIARLTAELDAATEALRDAFGAICPGYAYESPRQAARTIVDRYVRTENVLLEEIDGLRRELDAVRERQRVRDQAAQALCTIYFEIAAEAFGEDEVRRIRDECIDALASTPPDTEDDDV